jgi:hypothetical protein
VENRTIGAYLMTSWVEGVAPGPGDTAIIADPSGRPSIRERQSRLPVIGRPACPPGDTIEGQTIDHAQHG